MKALRKAGPPLLAAAMTGFALDRRFPGTSLLLISCILLVAGGAALVVSPFLGGEGDEAEPSGGAGAVQAPAGGGVPPPSGIVVPSVVPPWVYVLGAVLMLAGAGLYFNGPNGVSAYTVGTFSLMPLGACVIIGGHLYYGTPAARSNALYGALAIFSFLLIFGGVFTGVFIAAGAFSQEERLPYGGLGLLALAAGMTGAYFGLSRQRSAEGRAIGAELGFVDAGSGDGIYDSKGFMNGLEVLFDVEQQPPGRSAPAGFRLEVLCRCPNAAGLRLSVGPEGVFGFSAGSLPRIPDVPYWDFYVVRCDRPGEALRLLPPARREPGVFSEAAGFAGMSLEGREFKFSFAMEGYIGTEYVRRILADVSLLASKVG